jgi:hypothetical protein
MKTRNTPGIKLDFWGQDPKQAPKAWSSQWEGSLGASQRLPPSHTLLREARLKEGLCGQN